MPDLMKPPFHTLPHDELMAKEGGRYARLVSLQNLDARGEESEATTAEKEKPKAEKTKETSEKAKKSATVPC